MKATLLHLRHFSENKFIETNLSYHTLPNDSYYHNIIIIFNIHININITVLTLLCIRANA